jgi:hypothetical protein
MKLTLALMTTLWTASEAMAMGGPVYVDTSCDTMKIAPATPRLKIWLKGECPKGALTSDACADLDRFVRGASTNNEILRNTCGVK